MWICWNTSITIGSLEIMLTVLLLTNNDRIEEKIFFWSAFIAVHREVSRLSFCKLSLQIQNFPPSQNICINIEWHLLFSKSGSTEEMERNVSNITLKGIVASCKQNHMMLFKGLQSTWCCSRDYSRPDAKWLIYPFI